MDMSSNSILCNNSGLKPFVLFSTVGQSHWQTGKLCREICWPPHAWLHTLPVSVNTAAGSSHQMCPICNVFTLPVCLMASSCLIFLQKNMQCLHVSPLFLLSLCLLCPQACPVDHSGKASMSVAAGLDHGHAQPAASPWWPAFPGGQGDHWHPGQFLAAFSGGPRQGIKQ